MLFLPLIIQLDLTCIITKVFLSHPKYVLDPTVWVLSPNYKQATSGLQLQNGRKIHTIFVILFLLSQSLKKHHSGLSYCHPQGKNLSPGLYN